MAERLSDDDVALPAPPIDWSQFTDGSWWELTRGVDFEQTPARAANAFRAYCERHGLRSNAIQTPKGIRVRARSGD
jgi:hypothetical protein